MHERIDRKRAVLAALTSLPRDQRSLDERKHAQERMIALYALESAGVLTHHS